MAQPFGPVYTMTNATAGNEIAVGLRLPNGSIRPFARFATGGAGTGSGLGSQAAIATTEDDRWLLATNPGSDELTVFRVFLGLFLLRTDIRASGGDLPTSVAVHGDLVYAMNAGSDAVSGFHLRHGQLWPIAGATYALSQVGSAPAQVGFDPDGRFLVVTERMTNRIVVFPVQLGGTLGSLVANPSAGPTPFGFLFRRDGTLVVSEAAGGTVGASTVSTYRIQRDGTLATITAAAPTNQTAACWIAIPRGGEFAYSTNTGSGSITGYAIDRLGQLTRLDASGRTGDLGMSATPIDFEFDPRGRFLFTLDSTGDQIVTLERDAQGRLRLLPGAWSVPDGAAGVLVR